MGGGGEREDMTLTEESGEHHICIGEAEDIRYHHTAILEEISLQSPKSNPRRRKREKAITKSILY
jgi:hypothetical protein